MEIDNQITKYLNYCKNIRQMSPITINNKANILLRFINFTDIKDLQSLTNENVDTYIQILFALGARKSSVNVYVSTVKSFLKFYRDAGMSIYINLNMLPYFKNSKTVRKFYTRDEIEKVLKCAGETEKLMITVMFETGMRIAEIANLKVENLNGTKISFVGKGGKIRVVYLSINTSKTLHTYLKKYHIKDGYIWCVLNGVKTLNATPPTINTIRKNLQKVFQKAGFGGFYPHALRHSFATNLQKKGASVMEIKEMMGHSSIATTERYLHGFDGKLEELFKKYQ